jgi:hypothetical protein
VTRLTVVPLRASLIQGNDENLGAALRSLAGTLTCYRESRGVSAQKGSLSIEKVEIGKIQPLGAAPVGSGMSN